MLYKSSPLTGEGLDGGEINATVTLSKAKSPLLTGCFASLNMTIIYFFWNSALLKMAVIAPSGDSYF